MLQEGQRHRVTVEGYSSEGHGVARVDGQVVFVKGALVGEECEIAIEHVGHNAAWAGVEALTAPSPQRLTPDCPYYAQCGGCQTRHMSYPAELAFKSGKVRSALTRIGGVDPGQVPIHGARSPDRYRNKVQFPVAPGPAIGYFRERTHHVVDIADCLLTPAPCAAIRAAVRDWMTAYAVPAYDERSHTGLVRHLYIRSNAQGELLVCLLANGRSLPQEDALVVALQAAAGDRLTGVILGVNEKKSNVILGDSYRALWGRDYLMDSLCGLQFKLSVPSFFQVNRPQAEVLYGLARDFAGLTGAEILLDLYCGTGAIGLILAKNAKEVIGVEVVAEAIADARENARRNAVANARYLCADAGAAAAQLAAEGVRPDVVVVDPPRKGLSPQVVETLLAMSPRRIVYVSCDCATLARDVKLLSQGYALGRAEAVDMFPRTHHVETVCLLERDFSKEKEEGR